MFRQIQYGSAILVDRNNYQKKLLRSLLRTSGFIRITELDDMESGLDEAKRSHVDFMFVDYDTAMLSDLLRGFQNIRETHLNPSTHLLMLMQNPTRHRVDRAISCGANWVISRPFSPKIINRRMHALLEPEEHLSVNKHVARYQKHRTSNSSLQHELELTTEQAKSKALSREMDLLLKQSRFYEKGAAPATKQTRQELMKKYRILEAEYQRLQKNAADVEEEDVILL